MRQILITFFAVALMISSADLFAGRRSSSTRRTSTKKSYSPKKSTVKKSTVKKTRTTQKSTIKKKTTSKSKKPKAVSKSNIDKKQSKAMKSKNQAAGKKYGNKKTATTAYRKEVAGKNKYNSATAPSSRPSHVPATVSVGGTTYQTRYHMLPTGGYGYMRYNHLTGSYYVMSPLDYIITDMAMMNSGYGHWNANGSPYRYRNPLLGLWIFLGVVGIFLIILAIAKMSSRS